MSINNKIVKKDYIPLFLVGILIYYNNETFPSTLLKNSIEVIYPLFLIIAVFFFFKIVVGHIKIKGDSTFFVTILICLILSTMVLNGDFVGGYFKILISLVIGYMLIHIISIEEFTTAYVKIMVILAFYSLIATYVIKPFISIIPNSIFPVVYNASGYPFIDAKLSVILYWPNYYRNFGIFREPGVYQVFLNLALIFELFFKKRAINIRNIIVIYITIISTFSTPGYVSGIIIILLYIISRSDIDNKILNDKRNKRIIIICSFILLICAAIIYFKNETFRYQISNTINKLTKTESSFKGRSVSIFANIETWSERPIFGSGISKGISNSINNMQNNYIYSTIHNTSTTTGLLAVFGIIFTYIYTYYIYRLLSNIQSSKWIIFGVFIAVMISINTQLLIYNELMYTMVVFGMSNRCKNNKKIDINI